MTDPELKLKSALIAIESAAGALRRAQHSSPDSHEILLAVTELSDAEMTIRQLLETLQNDSRPGSRVGL